MLRNNYLDKYSKKKGNSKDDSLLKDDGEYILNNNRPLSAYRISKLPRPKLYQFMDDMLTNRKVNNILFSSNASKEISFYKQSNRFLTKNAVHPYKIKRKNTKESSSSIIRNRERMTEINKIKDDLDSFKRSKSAERMFYKKKSNRFFHQIENQQKVQEDLYFQPINEIRIKSYERCLNKCMSQLIKNPTFHFPDVKLNINDVYSRLYHNQVYLKGAADKQRKSRKGSFITEKGQSQTKKKKTNIFNVKAVVDSANGKEFTVKITDEMFYKCLLKHSGGPEVIFRRSKEEKMKLDNDGNPMLTMEMMRDENGNTKLHWSVQKESKEFTKYFIDKKMNCDAQNNFGDTPLHIAMRTENKEIIKMLLDAGANIAIRNKRKERPFDIASYKIKNYFELEKKMMEKGEPINK